MERLTDRLPGNQKLRLDRDFLENEKSYWEVRESLLRRSRGKWVAVRENLFDILDRAEEAGGHPYIARVGHEDLAFHRRQDNSSAPRLGASCPALSDAGRHLVCRRARDGSGAPPGGRRAAALHPDPSGAERRRRVIFRQHRVWEHRINLAAMDHNVGSTISSAQFAISATSWRYVLEVQGPRSMVDRHRALTREAPAA